MQGVVFPVTVVEEGALSEANWSTLNVHSIKILRLSFIQAIVIIYKEEWE